MSKKEKSRVLGRGLDAILKSPDTDITSRDISGNYVAGAIAELRLSQIEANPFQPRIEFDEMALRELAQSIKAQGVIQPITVRKMGYEKYQLISGERRLRASKLAGEKSIPAFIRVANDEQMLEMALIENIHRENLNAIDIAISYQRLMDECKLTQEKLSERIGKNRSTITNYLRLLKLPAEIQVALRDGLISMGHARAMINMDSEKEQLDLLQMIINEHLSVRQVEQLNQKQMPKQKVPAHLKTTIPDGWKEQAQKLSGQLNTKVNLKIHNNGKGSIVIHFDDDQELERIVKLMQES